MIRKSLIVLLLSSLTLPGLAQTSESPDPLTRQGLTALQNRDFNTAIQQLEASLRLNPENLPALQGLAAAYLAQNKLNLAEATLSAAHRLDRSHLKTHFLRGKLRFAQGEYLKARSEFRVPLYFKQQDPEPMYWLARTELALNNLEAAQKNVDDALASELSNAEQARFWGLQARLHPEDANSLFKKALKLADLPQALEAELKTDYYAFLLQSEQIETLLAQQAQDLKQAVKQNKTDEIIALLSAMKSSATTASAGIQERRLWRKHIETLYDKTSHSLLRQSLIQEMIKAHEYENLWAFYKYEPIAHPPKSELAWAKYYHDTADIYLKLNDLEPALENYKKAAEKNPRDAIALQRMGIIYFTAGDPGEALKYFKQTLDLNPLDRETRLMGALAMAYLGQKQDAKKILADLPPTDFTDLRTRIEAVMASGLRKPDKDLWKNLISEDEILSPELRQGL